MKGTMLLSRERFVYYEQELRFNHWSGGTCRQRILFLRFCFDHILHEIITDSIIEDEIYNKGLEYLYKCLCVSVSQRRELDNLRIYLNGVMHSSVIPDEEGYYLTLSRMYLLLCLCGGQQMHISSIICNYSQINYKMRLPVVICIDATPVHLQMSEGVDVINSFIYRIIRDLELDIDNQEKSSREIDLFFVVIKRDCLLIIDVGAKNKQEVLYNSENLLSDALRYSLQIISTLINNYKLKNKVLCDQHSLLFLLLGKERVNDNCAEIEIIENLIPINQLKVIPIALSPDVDKIRLKKMSKVEEVFILDFNNWQQCCSKMITQIKQYLNFVY